jgi:MarR family transcriptional regulator, organic hydroperoxide resistance regulator
MKMGKMIVRKPIRGQCFALTKYRWMQIMLAMKADLHRVAVEELQRYYPQIYLACHTRHIRAASTRYRLSAKDSSLLVHLSKTQPRTASELAAHMGIGASTLSAAIGRLAGLGYLRRDPSRNDRRVASLTLTEEGAKAMAATSVLDANRLAALMSLLTDEERKSAVEGMRLLASASSRLALRAGSDVNTTRAGKRKRGRERGRGRTNA